MGDKLVFNEQHVYNLVVDALAKKATKAILDDLGDRSGYDAIWDDCCRRLSKKGNESNFRRPW